LKSPYQTVPKSRVLIALLVAALFAFAVGWFLKDRSPKVAPPPKSPSQVNKTPVAPAPSRQPLSDEEREATANAKPCDFTVITNLDLSRPPTEAELIAAGNLGEKLTPTRSADPEKISDPAARKRQQLDNLTFGTAIQAWNDHRYDEALKLFTEHLESFPDSPWAAESMLHIGCHHQYTARFSESVEWFDKILASAPKDSEMYHKAKLRRTILNIDLGRLEDATAGFSEMMRDDPDPNHQS
jgi:tetratricopeptide (TPR) repeat protein